MPVIETLAGAVAGAVFSYLIQEANPYLPKFWGDSQTKAFSRAFERTYSTFSVSHPSWTNSFFDQTFLTGSATPILAKFVLRGEDLSEELYIAWQAQFRYKHQGRDRALQASRAFLNQLQFELRKEQKFQPLFDRLSRDTVVENTAKAAQHLEHIANSLSNKNSNRDEKRLGDWHQLRELTEACEAADELILMNMRVIERDRYKVPSDKVEKIHQALIQSFSYRDLTKPADIFETFTSSYADTRQVFEAKDIGCDIIVSDDMKRMEYCGGGKTLEILHPELLWDCSCFQFNDEGVYRQNKKLMSSCPIHSHENGSYFHKRFRTGIVKIHFRGMRLLWRRSPYLFPPSFDTLYMISDLVNLNAFDTAESILDLGSGTGILGISAIRHSIGASRLCFSDFLLTPLMYSSLNFSENVRRDTEDFVKLTTHFAYDMNANRPRDLPYSIGICNPPYLPMTNNYSGVAMSTSVAGTSLLEQALILKSTLCEKMYISFSHIAINEARSTSVKIRPVGPKRILPFRNVYAFRDKDYIDTLVSRRGLIYRKDGRYPYWHEVQTFAVD